MLESLDVFPRKGALRSKRFRPSFCDLGTDEGLGMMVSLSSNRDAMMNQIVYVERRKRGFFGTLFKWVFVLFNLAMAFWVVSYWAQVGTLVTANTGSQAGQAGSVIGGALGTGMLFAVWVVGGIVLGLLAFLTRGRKEMVVQQ
jgi:hypothetical protein